MSILSWFFRKSEGAGHRLSEAEEKLRTLDTTLGCVRKGEAMPSPEVVMEWAKTASSLAGGANKEVSRRAIELINEELAGVIGCGHIGSPRAMPLSKLNEIRRLARANSIVAMETFMAFSGATHQEAATLVAALAVLPE